MPKKRRRLGLAVSLLLIGLSCLSGCESGGHFTLLGYTTQPTFDCSIRTVYVPIPANGTYLKDIEFQLHEAVVRQLGTSPYRVTSDRARADTELLMRIVNTTKSTVLLNQLGETREAELLLGIEVVWRDLRPGRGGDILSNPKRFDPNVLPLPGEAPPPPPAAIPFRVTPTARWVPELGSSTLTAEYQAANRAAMQIINMMEEWR
jgi:hypothetical protein